jgi:hypothetical protein
MPLEDFLSSQHVSCNGGVLKSRTDDSSLRLTCRAALGQSSSCRGLLAL